MNIFIQFPENFDDEKTRIQLGMKQLEAHPWDALSADLKIGDRVKGKVVVLADYGAFVEIYITLADQVPSTQRSNDNACTHETVKEDMCILARYITIAQDSTEVLHFCTTVAEHVSYRMLHERVSHQNPECR